jgi:hypothetical protein
VLHTTAMAVTIPVKLNTREQLESSKYLR